MKDLLLWAKDQGIIKLETGDFKAEFDKSVFYKDNKESEITQSEIDAQDVDPMIRLDEVDERLLYHSAD